MNLLADIEAAARLRARLAQPDWRGLILFPTRAAVDHHNHRFGELYFSLNGAWAPFGDRWVFPNAAGRTGEANLCLWVSEEPLHLAHRLAGLTLDEWYVLGTVNDGLRNLLNSFVRRGSGVRPTP